MCSPPDLLLWNQSVPEKNSPAAMIAQIEQKLLNYNSQKLDIEEAIRNNDALGQGIKSLVETRATPREISKFKFHVEDTEKITNLLVSLSGRLARTEHALASSDYSLESEKANLISKRGKLQDQLNEAKFLQENIQKRSGVVSSYLQKYFSPSEFEDFERFLDRKSKNIMEI
jgi:protein Shroom